MELRKLLALSSPSNRLPLMKIKDFLVKSLRAFLVEIHARVGLAKEGN
jgi:hypothetical protein